MSLMTDQHLPHHDGSPLHVSDPYPELGETVRVRLRVPHSFGAVTGVHTRSNPDQEPRFLRAALVHTADGWDWWEAPVDVENPVTHYRWLVVRGDDRAFWVNATGVHETETRDSEDFRLTAYPEPPRWLREGVMYQVFPDRFAGSDVAASRPVPDWALAAAWSDPVDLEHPGRSRQLYCGDLDGVAQHTSTTCSRSASRSST